MNEPDIEKFNCYALYFYIQIFIIYKNPGVKEECLVFVKVDTIHTVYFIYIFDRPEL